MSHVHPYRNFQLPPDAPFELKPSPGKGWGAFATRQIDRGSSILRENALFVVWKPSEDTTETDVRTTFERLPPGAKEQFLQLRDNAHAQFSRMLKAFAENAFAVSTSAGSQASISTGYGLYVLLSRFNHSCIPNASAPPTKGVTLEIFAIKDIMAGEEITFCYNSHFDCRTRRERHQVLRFICDCKACLPGTRFQQLSDMRRTFIRGLRYLTCGVDLDKQRQSPTSTIVLEPRLKRAAEEFTIPLSSRMIYNLLIMFLREEEGVLNHFTVERLTPDLQKMADMFRTESNATIAKLTMEQRTWLEKLSTALRLYGQADHVDLAVTLGFRMSRNFDIEP